MFNKASTFNAALFTHLASAYLLLGIFNVSYENIQKKIVLILDMGKDGGGIFYTSI